MRICQKCQAQTDEAGQICRACGGILEEAAEVTVAVEEPADEAEPQPLVFRRDWRCPQCGETVPGNFDLCWRCMKNRPNDAPLASLGAMPSALPADDSHATEEDEGDGEPDIDAPVRLVGSHGIDDAETRESPAAVAAGGRSATAPRQCASCGSVRMIYGAHFLTSGQGSPTVAVSGNPDAVFFQDRMYGDVVTDVCGECGHIHLRVADPALLYNHMRRDQRDRN